MAVHTAIALDMKKLNDAGAVGVGRGVRAGTIWVNTFMDGTHELPFGGHRQSGIARELGHNAVKDYTEEKALHVHTGPRTAWWVPREA